MVWCCDLFKKDVAIRHFRSLSLLSFCLPNRVAIWICMILIDLFWFKISYHPLCGWLTFDSLSFLYCREFVDLHPISIEETVIVNDVPIWLFLWCDAFAIVYRRLLLVNHFYISSWSLSVYLNRSVLFLKVDSSILHRYVFLLKFFESLNKKTNRLKLV